MKYRLEDIHSEGIFLEGTVEKGWVKEQPYAAGLSNMSSSSLVCYSIHLRRSGSTVFAKGTVTTTVELSCSRCLESFDFPLSSEFSFSLVPEAVEPRISEKELRPEELETEFYDGETIDVGKIVQNNVLLGLPIKPLCRDDCGGLCPRCGTDKNKAACTCSTDTPGDPRMAELKNLFSKRDQ